MMRAMVKKMGESKLWTVANGVMDGIRIGAIVAAIMYGAILAVKFMLSDDLVMTWLNDYSWGNISTSIMLLIAAIAYWFFCGDSRMWRNYIIDRLEFEENISNVVYSFRANHDQLAREARQKRERELRPERYSEKGHKLYGIVYCSVVLLLVVSALVLSVSGLLVLKLMLTVMLSMVAVFAFKCTNRIVYGYWY